MAETSRKKNLGSQETMWVFSLVFLLSGLMFSVGLWVGYGFRPAEEKAAAHAIANAEHESHEEANRAPAAVVEDDRGGAALRAGFLQDKRNTLDRETLSREASTTPKSIEDSRAHLASHDQWTRTPAGAKDNSGDEARSRAMSAAAQEAERIKQGPGQNVRGLFERSTSSIDTFEPQPGRFTVQIASFATEDEARAKITKLREEGFQEAYYKTVKIRGGETWYRIFVGSFPTPVWAKRMGDKLKKQKMTTDFAIREVN